MTYMTESELRSILKKTPFVRFVVTKDKKLTPGARQFLIDKKIEIIYEDEDDLDEKSAYKNKSCISKSKLDNEDNADYKNDFQLLVSRLTFLILMISKSDKSSVSKLYKCLKIINDFDLEDKSCKETMEFNKEVDDKLPFKDIDTDFLLMLPEKVLFSDELLLGNAAILMCLEIKKFYIENNKKINCYQRNKIIHLFNTIAEFIS